MHTRKMFAECEAGRSNNFDALRAAFALTVIFSHSYYFIDGIYDNEPLVRASGGQADFGSLALCGFFLVSGYLITASWQRSGGAFGYSAKRALRILPGFLVVVPICTFLVAPRLVSDPASYWAGFDYRRWVVSVAKLGQPYTRDILVNGSLWTIRHESICYAFVLLLGVARLLRWPVLAAIALGCSLVQAGTLLGPRGASAGNPAWLTILRGPFPGLLACFAAGGILHLAAARIPRSNSLALACLAGLAAATAFPAARMLPVLFPYLGGYLVFWVAFANLGPVRDIARRGDLTYGLYLYAFPVQILLARALPGQLRPITLTLLAILATIPLAALSWFLVERPALALKRYLPARGRAIRAASPAP